MDEVILSSADKCEVTKVGDSVFKRYNKGYEHKFFNELNAYQEVSFASPKLLSYDTDALTLEIEYCTPILSINKDESRKYMQPLWDLLKRIHDVGRWHRDIALRNVVVHDERGVLLIDWESSTQSFGSKSLDLYGAVEVGISPDEIERVGARPTDIYWYFDWDECPEKYWKG